MNIAVVDAGANLKAFARMDGAWLGSIDIAIKKARTARFFDMNTGETGKLSQPGGALCNNDPERPLLTWVAESTKDLIIILTDSTEVQEERLDEPILTFDTFVDGKKPDYRVITDDGDDPRE